MIPLSRIRTLALTAAVATTLMLSLMPDDADARARRGGRSFTRSRTFSRPAAPRQTLNTNRTAPRSATGLNRPGGSSFLRGLGGGLLGGFIGNMLFGRPGYGMGAGGFGGSGIGLLEILLFGGLAWFLFKRLARPAAPRGPDRFELGNFGRTGNEPHRPVMDIPPAAPGETGIESTPAGLAAAGIDAIRQSDPRFDPELFKEGAQDIFFKVQAAWMRRDLQGVQTVLGDRLAEEYRNHFEEMRAQGTVNRLENIAVRRVDIVDAGIASGFAFVTVEFTANLLDYTVEESSGQILSGSDREPVKFNERWTFGAPVNTADWKLEAIE